VGFEVTVRETHDPSVKPLAIRSRSASGLAHEPLEVPIGHTSGDPTRRANFSESESVYLEVSRRFTVDFCEASDE